MCAWAPLGAGILTGKYTAGTSMLPEDSRRAAANQARLTERNLAIAREVDRVADALGPRIELPSAAPIRWRSHTRKESPWPTCTR